MEVYDTVNELKPHICEELYAAVENALRGKEVELGHLRRLAPRPASNREIVAPIVAFYPIGLLTFCHGGVNEWKRP